jgi:hypothetical protein
MSSSITRYCLGFGGINKSQRFKLEAGRYFLLMRSKKMRVVFVSIITRENMIVEQAEKFQYWALSKA